MPLAQSIVDSHNRIPMGFINPKLCFHYPSDNNGYLAYTKNGQFYGTDNPGCGLRFNDDGDKCNLWLVNHAGASTGFADWIYMGKDGNMTIAATGALTVSATNGTIFNNAIELSTPFVFKDKITDEECLRISRVGANNYTFEVKQSGSWVSK